MPSPALPPTGTVTVSANPSLSGFSGTANLSSSVDPAYGAVEGVATFIVPAGSINSSFSLSVT